MLIRFLGTLWLDLNNSQSESQKVDILFKSQENFLENENDLETNV